MRKRDSHIFAKERHGHYVEPAWCSERLFEEVPFAVHETIWDPACGWGTILHAASAANFYVIGSDVVDRKRHNLGRGFFKYDFLTGGYAPPQNFSVVCNPPFDHVEEFARRAIDLGARKVALIMLVRRLNAAHWLRELPLKKIWLLTPRPSMPPGEWIAKGNKPGGGTQDFCWLLFERGYTGTPELGWLERDSHGSGLVLCADKTVARVARRGAIAKPRVRDVPAVVD